MKLEVEVVGAHSLVDFMTGETKFWAVVMLGETAAEVPLTMEQYEAMLESYSNPERQPVVTPEPAPTRELGGGDALGAEVKRVLREGGPKPAPVVPMSPRSAAEADASDGFNPDDDE